MIQTLSINDGLVLKNSTLLLNLQSELPEDIYRALGFNYPKFFKMDLLCKWAWLGTEILLQQDKTILQEGFDKSRVAVVLATGSGCIVVDKKYQETMQTIPSPALFVYTLPNIMLGEICIRHGFKGEQLCMVQENFDAGELSFWVNDLLQNRGMDYCLTGWVNATGTKQEVCLYWLSGKDDPLTAEKMQEVFRQRTDT